MAQAVLLAKRPRPNYSLSNLEQQRPGASTPGWLAKTQTRSGADTPLSGNNGSPESNASSKENKVPPGRGRAASKKPVAKPVVAAQDCKSSGRKAGSQPAQRPKSMDSRQKQTVAEITQKAARKGCKSAPAKADKPAQPKLAEKLAAESPAGSDGSKGGMKSTRARKTASPPKEAAEVAVREGQDTAEETPQPVAQKSSDLSGRATNKRRASTDQPQSADKGAKRRRTGPVAAEAMLAAADAAAEAGANAAPTGAMPPPRRASARARAAGSPVEPAQPANHGARRAASRPAARAAETAERPAPPAESADGAAAGASQAGDPVASTPGSDLARRVDANISALQADYSKLQAAYQAMKRQSAQPHGAAKVPLAAPAPPSDSFLKLQAAHEELLQRYKELKAKKMEGLQDVLAAQATQVEEHRAAANKVAEHWKAEAARHEAAAAAAQAPQMQAEVQALRDGRQRLQEQALDLRAGIAERDSRIAQLQHQLARAQLAAQIAEAAQAAAEKAAAELQQAADAGHVQQEAAAVVEDVLQHLEAGAAMQAAAAEPQSMTVEAVVAPAAAPADATMSVGSDQATASPAAHAQLHMPQPTPFHLKEARAMCPEGLSLSDTYCQPSASSSHASGRVIIQAAGHALVPYANGASRELMDGSLAEGSRSTMQTPGPGAESAAEASPSQTQCAAPPAAGGGTPSNASLPVRHLQFTSAARAAAMRPAGGDVVQAGHAAAAQAAAQPGGPGNPLQILTGFESSPFKNGGFLFEHHACGYTFRLMPLADNELLYRPYTLGELHDDMPAFLRSEMTIDIGQRNKLLNHIMDVLVRHTGSESLGADG